MTAMFRDRRHAGQELAAALARMEIEQPVVLALPRGGVPVAVEIARELNAPLDLLLVRKVGAPHNPELAVAAIVDGNPDDLVINREIVEAYGLDDEDLKLLVKNERPELERRRAVYRGRRRPLSLTGKTAIVVDDGVATGTTTKVALRAVRRRGPKQVILAVPVGAPDAIDELAPEADLIVCLSKPARFRALGFHYLDFEQLTDDEVLSLMRQAQATRKAALAAERARRDAG
jgi:putative phosphoribosyl transferase